MTQTEVVFTKDTPFPPNSAALSELTEAILKSSSNVPYKSSRRVKDISQKNLLRGRNLLSRRMYAESSVALSSKDCVPHMAYLGPEAAVLLSTCRRKADELQCTWHVSATSCAHTSPSVSQACKSCKYLNPVLSLALNLYAERGRVRSDRVIF